jgi:hypothetical protein
MKRSSLCVAVLAAASLSLAACGDKTVSSDEVAKQAQSQFDKIAQNAGQKTFPKITCPDDLDAKKGAKTRCSAKGNDGTLGITVTVASVKDDKAQLNFKGDSKLKK